jgi:hypothetical protein
MLFRFNRVVLVFAAAVVLGSGLRPLAGEALAVEVVPIPLGDPLAGPSARVAVLVPKVYETNGDSRFRVLYVLPVEPDGQKQKRFGDPLAVIESLGLHDKHGLICIAVHYDETTWLGDHAADPRHRHATHMVEAVVPFVDGRYRTVKSAEGRLLLGFSKAGWAAVTLILRHGDTFGVGASWDAPLMFTDKQFGIWKTDVQYGTPAAMAAQLPTTLLRQHAGEFRDRPRLVIAGSKLFGTFTDKNFPYDGPSQTEAFHELADEQDVSHVYEPEIRAEHTWNKKWLGPVVDRLLEIAPQAHGVGAAEVRDEEPGL